MESMLDTIIDFVRVRQLNLVIVALLTAGYIVYQYWGDLFKGQLEEEDSRHMLKRTRSRSRSRSRHRSGNYDYKIVGDSKHGRRSRKAYRRCSECSGCSLCQSEN